MIEKNTAKQKDNMRNNKKMFSCRTGCHADRENFFTNT